MTKKINSGKDEKKKTDKVKKKKYPKVYRGPYGTKKVNKTKLLNNRQLRKLRKTNKEKYEKYAEDNEIIIKKNKNKNNPSEPTQFSREYYKKKRLYMILVLILQLGKKL